MDTPALDYLTIKLGGLPPWLAKKVGDKKADPKKPHSFSADEDDPKKCSVCSKAKADALHTSDKKANPFGGKQANPFGKKD